MNERGYKVGDILDAIEQFFSDITSNISTWTESPEMFTSMLMAHLPTILGAALVFLVLFAFYKLFRWIYLEFKFEAEEKKRKEKEAYYKKLDKEAEEKRRHSQDPRRF